MKSYLECTCGITFIPPKYQELCLKKKEKKLSGVWQHRASRGRRDKAACGLWTLSEEYVRVPVSGRAHAFGSPSATVVIKLWRPWGVGRAGSLALSPNLECLLPGFFAFGMKTVHAFQTNEEWGLPRQQHLAPRWQRARDQGAQKSSQ